MSDTVQLSDQYLLGSSLKSDPPVHVSKGKRSVYVSDLNQGSYTSGLVTIDATNQLNGAQGYSSLREAYLTVPYVITAKNTGVNTNALRLSRFATTLKTGVWNVISDLEVEINGKQILTTNEYKNFWNNLRAMTETSVSDMYKHGSDMFLQPDDWFSINFDSAASGNGDGYSNNALDISQTIDATLGQTQEHRAFNSGLYNRLCSSSPMIIDKTTNNSFGWATMGTGAQSQIAAQTGRGAFIEVASAAAAGAVAGTWVYMLKIRLVDLHPLFKELDLVANPQIKLRYRVNTGVVEIGGNGSTMSLLSSTITSGNTCPIIVASTASNCPMNGVLSSTAGSKISFAFGALQNGFTTTATIAEVLPYTTTRLHIPFYDLENQSALVSKPVKTVRYLDCFAQYFKGRAGAGVIAGQQNAAFNFQLSASLKNVKYVALVPYADTTTGHWANAVVAEQFQSPFDSAPYTCQPGSVVRNFQVQIGNVNAFAKTHEYDYESFMEEFCKISSINGDIDRTMNTGLVDIDRWSFAQRIMVADVSRLTEKDVPTAIQVSGINSCSQSSNYLCLCVYERELEIDRLTGEVQRTD